MTTQPKPARRIKAKPAKKAAKILPKKKRKLAPPRKPEARTIASEARIDQFVIEYMVDQHGQNAAIRAGAPAKSAKVWACKMLKRADVQAKLAKVREERAKRTMVDADYVLRQAVELHERCMQVRPVLDKKGNQVMVETPDGLEAPAFTFDSAGAARGLELVGKHVGVQAFKETIEHKGNIDTKWTMEVIQGKPKPVDP